MSKNYFAIERNRDCWMNVGDANIGDVSFENFAKMTYDEMKSSEYLESFVIYVMDTTNIASGTNDDLTTLTLIGEDGVFIWGIVMTPGENEDIKYTLIDWKKDGKSYRYAPEITT